MIAGREIDQAEQYEAAAEFVARTYGRPITAALARALLNLPDSVIEDIEANPHYWDRRVHEYLYGMEA